MIELVLFGAAFLAGVDALRLVVLATVLYLPLLAVLLVVIAVLRERSSTDDRGVLLCEAIASELRSGSPMNRALAEAATSVGLDVAEGDYVPKVEEVIETISREFEDIASELRATIETAMRSGGGAADIFDEIGAIAIAETEISHEVRVSSASARATAWFFVLAPTTYVWFRLVGGGATGLLESPQQRIPAFLGMVMFLAGLSLVIVLLRRAR